MLQKGANFGGFTFNNIGKDNLRITLSSSRLFFHLKRS
jgi:hypothetical protein